MMTEQQIRQRHKDIDRSYGSNGRNLYRCSYAHYTLVRHLHRGVTPMFIQCACCAKEKRDVNAASMMYAIPQKGVIRSRSGLPITPHHHEKWVRPDVDELVNAWKNGMNDFTVEHVLMGGLLFESTLNQYAQNTNT